MLDIIIIVILLYGAIRGYLKGFFIQSLTLVALFLGIWVGVKLNPYLSNFLNHTFSINPSICPYISFTVLFVLVIILVHFIGVFFTKSFDKAVIGTFNRICGSAFGILKFAFLISVCLFLIQKFDKKEKVISKSSKEQSKLYAHVSKIAPAVFSVIHFEEVKKGVLGY